MSLVCPIQSGFPGTQVAANSGCCKQSQSFTQVVTVAHDTDIIVLTRSCNTQSFCSCSTRCLSSPQDLCLHHKSLACLSRGWTLPCGRELVIIVSHSGYTMLGLNTPVCLVTLAVRRAFGAWKHRAKRSVFARPLDLPRPG